MNCQYCRKPLPAALPGGHRVRAYCNQACKQADYRKRHGNSQARPSVELQEALARIEELETLVMRLRNQLDVERRFHEDHQKRSFKAWLKKQPAAHVGDVGQRILSDEFLPIAGSRALYEAHLRKNKYSSDELAEFTNLWKLMLLQS